MRLMGLGIIVVTVPGGNQFSGSFTKGEAGNETNTARTRLLARVFTLQSAVGYTDGIKEVGSNTVLSR